MMTTRRSTQGGFTLLELMISVTIGLVITVLIANLFIASRTTYAASEDSGRMQDNMRFT